MGFILKSGFWFSVVLLFLPENPETLQVQRELAQNSARGLIEITENTLAFCKDRPMLCEAALQSSKAAGEYVNMAADELRKAQTTTK